MKPEKEIQGSEGSKAFKPVKQPTDAKDTSWSSVAGWYDELIEQSPDSYQKNVLMPNLIRIVAPKKGMTILDVACGQGYFSRAFQHNGATVIGYDISRELIDLAKKQVTKDMTFYVSPADSMPFMADNSVDVAVIILALQNIENLAGTLAECSRVLRRGGRLVAVLNHPAFRIPGRSSWAWDDKTNAQYRRLDGYMSDSQNKIDMTPGEKIPAKKTFTLSFHRPLQSYFKALTKANLSVIRLEEWISHKKSLPGPRAAEEDRMRKEMPMFICLEARK